jgi:hypothetical protein
VTAAQPVLRLLLDEGIPDSVGHVFLERGHQVGFLNKTLARGSADPLVCAIADINQAILVAGDGDMKRIAQSYGIRGGPALRDSSAAWLMWILGSITPPISPRLPA